jgi:hypothetical protein
VSGDKSLLLGCGGPGLGGSDGDGLVSGGLDLGDDGGLDLDDRMTKDVLDLAENIGRSLFLVAFLVLSKSITKDPLVSDGVVTVHIVFLFLVKVVLFFLGDKGGDRETVCTDFTVLGISAKIQSGVRVIPAINGPSLSNILNGV